MADSGLAGHCASLSSTTLQDSLNTGWKHLAMQEMIGAVERTWTSLVMLRRKR